MAIYTIIYWINSLGFVSNRKSKKIINFIAIMLLIFISGTRYRMGGSDVLVYENVYNGGKKDGTSITGLSTDE